MSNRENIDVLDILIELLTDYEIKMDELVNRFELLVEHFEAEGSVPQIAPDVEPSLIDVLEDIE